MATISVLERERSGGLQPKACVVSEQMTLESIRRLLIDTNQVILKERLLDLTRERDCNLYVVDTEVKDLDAWPAPLLTIPNARDKDWLFLVSKLSDVSPLQPMPRNAELIDRRRLSAEKIALLIEKRLDPESRRRFERVRFM